jgi:hypothetical protein
MQKPRWPIWEAGTERQRQQRDAKPDRDTEARTCGANEKPWRHLLSGKRCPDTNTKLVGAPDARTEKPRSGRALKTEKNSDPLVTKTRGTNRSSPKQGQNTQIQQQPPNETGRSTAHGRHPQRKQTHEPQI